MPKSAVTDTLSSISIGPVSLFEILSVILVFLVCLIAIKILMAIITKLLANSRLEPAVRGFLRSGCKGLLWVIAIIIVAGSMGIETASLVALLSVAGLALSLSVQGVMTNLFSGITILTNKPFVAGDYVDLDGASGVVMEVGLFYTTVTTVDNKIVYIPNGQVAAAKIVNYTRQDKRRVDLTFTASYNDSTESVKEALLAAARSDRRVLDEPAAPFAGLLSYKDSSIEYVLRVWTSSDDYWDVYFSLNEKVRESFKEKGIEMTYNHLNVHLDK